MKLKKFYPLVKMVDQPDGTLHVYGLVTAEKPDLDKEVFDYDKSKPYYIAKVEATKKATSIEGMEQSLMPLRSMHSLDAIGKGVSIDFNDDAKTIHMGFEVVDPLAIKKFKKGVFVGFSQGGSYIQPKDWPTLKIKDPVYKGCVRYVSDPGEVSGVDSPCLPIALIESMKAKQFEYVKADGSTSLRKFHSPALSKTAKPQELHIDASQVEAGILKVNGQEYEPTEDANPEVTYADRAWKRKGPSVDERLGKIETLLTKALQKDSEGIDYNFDDAVVGENQQCQCPCDECVAGNCADCTHENCDCDNCLCPDVMAGQKAAKGVVPGPGLPEKPAPAVATMEANVTKDEEGKKKIKDKAAAMRALLKLKKDAPDADKAVVKAAMKEFAVDAAAEVKKFADALAFMKMDSVQKCIMDVHDMADVLGTLRMVTNWQAMEAAEEDDKSKVPEHMFDLLTHAVTVFRELVEEETAEILATTSGGGKEEKAMTTEELQKAASAHLKKAMEMVKAHADHLGAVSKAHLDNVSSLNKAHGAAMDGAGSVTACKALHKAHQTHMDGVHKAHHDHIVGLAKAHTDAMAAHFGKADSPEATDIVKEPTENGQITTVDPMAGAPHSTKALTLDDLNTALAKAISENTATLEKKHGEELEALVKAMLEPETVASDVAAAPGIGNRAAVVTTKVQQTHPVTKAGEMTDTGGQPVAVAPAVTKDDVLASNNGDQDATLKLARSIKAAPAGFVPSSLSGSGLMKRA
jgi:hypothetical protein